MLTNHFLGVAKVWALLLLVFALTLINPIFAPAESSKAIELSTEERQLFQDLLIELPKSPVPVKAFQADGLNGAHTDFTQYQGKMVLLNFWATWCVPCLREMPDMEALQQSMNDYPFVVLAISMGEKAERVKPFLQKHGFSFPVMLDPDMSVSELFGVQNLPVTYLIDPEQNIFARAVGPRNWHDPDLVRFFQQRLKTDSP